MGRRSKQGDKDERSKRLIELSGKKNLEFIKENIGKKSRVLFEKTRNEGFITGFAENYIRVEYPYDSKLACRIRNTELTGIAPGGRMQIKLID